MIENSQGLTNLLRKSKRGDSLQNAAQQRLHFRVVCRGRYVKLQLLPQRLPQALLPPALPHIVLHLIDLQLLYRRHELQHVDLDQIAH
jgi:hypothetical protein